MNAAEMNALTSLLQHAMAGAVIRDSYRGSPIDTGAYLRLLATHRLSFDPEQRMLAARFKPEIGDDSVREELLDRIRTTLAQYIHNDTLQSATIVTGGALDGFRVIDLMSHLVTISFIRGAQHAARSFHECAENSDVAIQFITLLDGITIERNIEISEGIRLVPIPNSADDFSSYIITPHFGHYTEYYGRTLIVVDQRVSPIFAHPSEMSTKNTLGPFIRTNLNTSYRDFNVAEFCEALSLSANHMVNYTAWWTHVNPDDAYAVKTTGQSPVISSSFHTRGSIKEVNDDDIGKAMSLYIARKNLASEVTQKLRVPIDRWMKAKMDANPVDVFINLGTAMESLYLNDVGNAGEFRFRLALRAAWYLGKGGVGRRTLFGDFKEIYDRRSKAAHTGKLTESEQTSEFTRKAQDLCRKSIVRIIEDGQFPDWNQLVLGE